MNDIVERLEHNARDPLNCSLLGMAADSRDAAAEILRLRVAALREPAGDLVEVAVRAIRHTHSRDGVVEAVLDAVLPRVRAEERERIAAELDEEAAVTPCAEDAMVTRDCARLVRARFSYDEAERLTSLPAPPDAAP